MRPSRICCSHSSLMTTQSSSPQKVSTRMSCIHLSAVGKVLLVTLQDVLPALRQCTPVVWWSTDRQLHLTVVLSLINSFMSRDCYAVRLSGSFSLGCLSDLFLSGCHLSLAFLLQLHHVPICSSVYGNMQLRPLSMVSRDCTDKKHLFSCRYRRDYPHNVRSVLS